MSDPGVPRISVVIPVFNNADVLGDQLRAVSAQAAGGHCEIIVADNGSTDGSRSVAEGWAGPAPVRVVDASARRGPGAARNIAVAAACGELIVFTDADDVAQPGWLAACVAGLEQTDAVTGAVDFTSLNGLAPRGPQDPSPPLGYLRAGLGTNLAVRRAAFDAVGGFAEQLRVGEDIDFCWRLQLAGFGLRFVPGAVVAKRGRATGVALARQSIAYGQSDVVLYTRFRAAGMPRRSWQTVRSWGWLVARLPTTVRPEGRAEWLRVLFIRLGRLVGCVRYRVLFP